MNYSLTKNIFISVICLLFCFGEMLWAKDTKNCFVSSEPLILDTLPIPIRAGENNKPEVFVDSNNRVIVLCISDFIDKSGYKVESSLFVFANNTWVKSDSSAQGGMINDGVFYAYITHTPNSEKNVKVPTISIYNLKPDMKLSSNPLKVFKMHDKKELSERKELARIKPLCLPGVSDKLFFVGQYTESNLLNPIAAFGYVVSGGHGGYVIKAFGAKAVENQNAAYFDIPQKLANNECELPVSSIIMRDKVHLVLLKKQVYSGAPVIVQYANFDLAKDTWIKPVELFRGYKYSKKINEFISLPSLACNEDNVYCTWTWSISDRHENGLSLRDKESGIYFCSRTKDCWDKPIKIADFGYNPQVVINNKGTIYLFWTGEGKGLFCKYKTNTDWSDTYLTVKDSRICCGDSSSASIAVDNDDNLHIVYLRKSPKELVYLKLLLTEK